MADTPAQNPAQTPPEKAQGEKQQFDRRMLEMLVCPQSHTQLSYDADKEELVSKAAGVAYPIRNGIPIMLLSEARALGD